MRRSKSEKEEEGEEEKEEAKDDHFIFVIADQLLILGFQWENAWF